MSFNKLKISVVGAGTMGHSIAQVFATHGFETALTDQSAEQLKRAGKMIAGNLDTLVGIGEICREDVKNVQERIRYYDRIEDAVSSADYVVETVSENPVVKRELYGLLDKHCSASTIFASNTSALNIYDFVEISHQERLIIAHWFNPPHIMPLVEIVSGPKTSAQTVDTVKSLMVFLGKTPAVMNQYVPGFIINRLSIAILREVGYMVAQGWTHPEDVDAAIVATFGPRYVFEGPMELCDHVGWDVVQSVWNFLAPRLHSGTEPLPLIADLCAQGHLGVKSGRGIKDYGNKDIGQIQHERNMKIIKMLKAAKEL